jgi:hypothetical protein
LFLYVDFNAVEHVAILVKIGAEERGNGVLVGRAADVGQVFLERETAVYYQILIGVQRGWQGLVGRRIVGLVLILFIKKLFN